MLLLGVAMGLLGVGCVVGCVVVCVMGVCDGGV